MHFLQAAVEDSDFSHAFRADVFQRVHSRAIRLNLNHNIPVFIHDVVDELNVAINDEFKDVTDSNLSWWLSLIVVWTPIVLYDKVLSIVARETYRMYVGVPLCM
jgi:hypothetical protein